MNELIKGVFIKECKGRFYCEVEIAGNIENCYVASSANLRNFIDLHNKDVYLLNNKNVTRTKYTLYALKKDKKNAILLNLNKVNEILINYLISNGQKVELLKCEITLKNSFKADVVYYSSPTVVYEVKTIISKENNVKYPCVQSKRVKVQLEKIISLLNEGYIVEYIFFLLEPKIKIISIEDIELINLFSIAINLNMKIRIYKTLWNGNDFYIKEVEKIKNDFIKNILGTSF